MENDTTYYTLGKFVELYGDLNSISAIYVDDEKDTIRNTIMSSPKALEILRKKINLLHDDDFLILNDKGDYVLNKEKIIDLYSDFIVSLYLPIIRDDYKDQFDKIFDEDMTDSEYITILGKNNIKCDILIRPVFDEDLDPEFYPKINSDIECIVIMDYYESDNPNESPITTLVGVVKNEDELKNAIEQRKLRYTAAFHMNHGETNLKTAVLYYTEADGTITEVEGSGFEHYAE